MHVCVRCEVYAVELSSVHCALSVVAEGGNEYCDGHASFDVCGVAWFELFVLHVLMQGCVHVMSVYARSGTHVAPVNLTLLHRQQDW